MKKEKKESKRGHCTEGKKFNIEFGGAERKQKNAV